MKRATDVYRPQWAYPVPAGFRDEVWIMGPFPIPVNTDGSLNLNLPVQSDDDVRFFIRSIMIDARIGTISPNAGMLCRIRDTYGNPLSAGLVLGMGIWGNQINGLNGFGFVMEPEVEVSPGGALLFDIQALSSGTGASFTKTGFVESITFVATVTGPGGGAITIALVNPGAPDVPLSVAVVGNAVTVTLATNGASAITSTFLDVQTIINGTPASAALMFALVSSVNPFEVITALAATNLAGGTAGGATTLLGTFCGVKRFPLCITT